MQCSSSQSTRAKPTVLKPSRQAPSPSTRTTVVLCSLQAPPGPCPATEIDQIVRCAPRGHGAARSMPAGRSMHRSGVGAHASSGPHPSPLRPGAVLLKQQPFECKGVSTHGSQAAAMTEQNRGRDGRVRFGGVGWSVQC